jgi:hypothetical protein
MPVVLDAVKFIDIIAPDLLSSPKFKELRQIAALDDLVQVSGKTTPALDLSMNPGDGQD